MIVIDTSILVSIALAEPEAIAFRPILATNQNLIGWHTLLKTKTILSRVNEASPDTFLMAITRQSNVQMIGFTEKLWPHAAMAQDRYGKGQHPAALTFSECMTYAIAATHDAPLLFKGDRFAQTDIAIHNASMVTGGTRKSD